MKRNKFNARKVSGLKKKTGDNYEWRKKAGEVIDYTNQHLLRLDIYGHTICTYKIDFRAEIAPNVLKGFPEGCIDYEEVKGFPTADWRIKWKLTQALFHDLTIGEDARLLLNGKVVIESHK